MDMAGPVTLDSFTKIENLLILVESVHDQLMREGRVSSAWAMSEALHNLEDARAFYNSKQT